MKYDTIYSLKPTTYGKSVEIGFLLFYTMITARRRASES